MKKQNKLINKKHETTMRRKVIKERCKMEMKMERCYGKVLIGNNRNRIKYCTDANLCG